MGTLRCPKCGSAMKDSTPVKIKDGETMFVFSCEKCGYTNAKTPQNDSLTKGNNL